ncbi:hypothetical protein [Fibrella forsythiae]|uniref:hypothetical protein n=1 Tax=Fibrella forsythiae TaxID=2817061 RepID=UPI001E4287F8|nr:hypothetical protein [Fibrella forsythiae]
MKYELVGTAKPKPCGNKDQQQREAFGQQVDGDHHGDFRPKKAANQKAHGNPASRV